MKKVCVLTILALFVVLTSSAFAGDPVRLDPVLEGHYYQIVDVSEARWTQAADAAAASSYHGVGGHLVVITSMAEAYFITELIAGGNPPLDSEYWIGLVRGCETCPWIWVTGEQLTSPNLFWEDEGSQTTSEHFAVLRADDSYGTYWQYWWSMGNGLVVYAYSVVEYPNPPPSGDAGQDQLVVEGTLVALDGVNSSDPDNDYPLTFSWEMSSKPNESSAALNDPSSETPYFTPDVPGDYVIQLVVTDSFGASSEPDNVTVNAFSWQQEVVDTLNETITTIDDFSPDVFKNTNMKKALINKINAVLQLIDLGFYGDAYTKLKNDLLKKTDGCANSGVPDKNDWIKNCETQNQLYTLITYAIDLLEPVR